MTSLRRIAGVAALAVAASACQVSVSMTTTVAEDGTGRFSIAIAADAEVVALQESQGGLRPVTTLFDGLRDAGWAIAQSEPDGGIRYEASRSFDDVAEFDALLGELRGARSADDEGELGEVDFALALDYDASQVQTTTEFSGRFDTGTALQELPPEILAELQRLVTFEIAADLPGDPIVSEGAATIEDGVVVWRPQLGQATTFAASSTIRDPSLFIGLLLGGAALLLLVFAGLARGRRRRRRLDRLSAMRIESMTGLDDDETMTGLDDDATMTGRDDDDAISLDEPTYSRPPSEWETAPEPVPERWIPPKDDDPFR